MNLNIEDDKVKAMVAEAILKVIPQEAREKMISNAIYESLKPGDRYGRSPMIEAFERAVLEHTRATAVATLSKDEKFQKAIQAMVTTIVTKLTEPAAQEAIIGGIVDAVSRAFKEGAEAFIKWRN